MSFKIQKNKGRNYLHKKRNKKTENLSKKPRFIEINRKGNVSDMKSHGLMVIIIFLVVTYYHNYHNIYYILILFSLSSPL